MRVHVYYCYWIGGAAGFLVGVAMLGGIMVAIGDPCSVHLPAITMGGRAQ